MGLTVREKECLSLGEDGSQERKRHTVSSQPGDMYLFFLYKNRDEVLC